MTPSYGRTQKQHDNLQKLIDGLKALPDDYSLLDMNRFAINDGEAIRATPIHPCGTSMCIVGHGPSFGIPFTDEDGNDWVYYSKRAFGFSACTRKWEFCFDPLWPSDVNQAIIRLEMAQREEIPVLWDFDDKFPEIL